MAEEDLSLEEPKEGDGDATESSGSNKKLIIIIAVLATVIVLGGAVAAWLLLGSDDEAEATTQEQTELVDADMGADDNAEAGDASEPETKKIAPPPKGEAIYVGIPDPFLVNIQSGKRSRMMQVRVQLMVRSEEAEDAVKLHMPLIRNNLLDFFSTADGEVVSTREGRKELKDEAFKVAQEVVLEQAGFEAIEMLLFTGFVIQ
jgi:flagellar FliL protein